MNMKCKVYLAVGGFCETGFMNRSSGKYCRPEFIAETSLAWSTSFALLLSLLLVFSSPTRGILDLNLYGGVPKREMFTRLQNAGFKMIPDSRKHRLKVYCKTQKLD